MNIIPIKKNAFNAFDTLKSSFQERLGQVEELIQTKLSTEVDLVKQMTDYHLSSGGKRLRALLTLASANLSNYKEGGRDINLAACVELIHSATLLHDDVIDESKLRRNKKTTNSIWGNQSSILVGDYLLSRCFEMMVNDGDLNVLKLLSSTSAMIAQGEVLQLQHKGKADLLEETYLKIINMKTAALFSAAVEVGGIIAKKNKNELEALASYGKNLGTAFQIADDALDFYSKEKIFGKKIGKDFFEGKTTFPIIITFQRSEQYERDFLKMLFVKKERTEFELNKVIELMNKYKTLDACFKRAEHFVNVAHDSLAIFENSKIKNLLQDLTQFSLKRDF